MTPPATPRAAASASLRAALALGRLGSAVGLWVEARPWRRIAALLLLCCVLHLPGIAALPVTDRDEARFAQATRQMLETGDFIDIRFQDEPRWKKPVGIYWMQAAAVKLAGGPEGVGIWAWRIPSAIGAFAATLAALWAFPPLLGRRAGLIAAALTGATVILAAEANIAKTDAMLLALTMGAMGAWIRLLENAGLSGPPGDVYTPPRHIVPLRAVLWGALGLAVLVKGPIAPAVLLLSALWLSVTERSLRPFRVMGWIGFGPLLFLLVILPWLAAIWVVSDGAFFAEAVGRDLIGKMASGQEKHGAPPGVYLAVAWAVLWPWAPLMILAAGAAWRSRGLRASALLLGWAIPFWIILEATPTKLPHYLLPVAPALAGLCALWLASAAPPPRRWQSILAAVLFGLVGLALAGANIAMPVAVAGEVSWPAAALGLAGLVFTALGTLALWRDLRPAALTAMFAAAMTLIPATLQFGLPALAWGFPSEAMARASAPFAACTGRPAATQSYREPSLVFLQGTATRLLQPEEAAAVLRDEPGAMVWLEDRRRDLTLDAMGEAPPALTDLAVVEAFNPNRGKPTTLRLTAREGDPVLAPCLK